jgi:hypothetical protein
MILMIFIALITFLYCISSITFSINAKKKTYFKDYNKVLFKKIDKE